MTTATPHTPENAQGVEPDDLDTPQIVLWGFFSVVIVVCLMFVAVALFYDVQSHLDRSRLLAPVYTKAEDYVLAQKGILSEYKGPAAGSVMYQIPIDRAKRLVVRELSESRKAGSDSSTK